MKTKLFLFSITIAVILSACKGEDGPQGPQGPQGATGAPGPSNITVTNFTATPGTWNGGGPWWYIDVPVSALTNAANDLVSVYVQIPSFSSDWWAIPATALVSSTDNYQFSYGTGTVVLWYNDASAPAYTYNYKIVVVPPSIARDNSDVDFNNYSKVKATFNLQD